MFEEFSYEAVLLIIVAAGVLISFLIKLFILIRNRNRNDINFDEFQDTEKIKERQERDEDQIYHEANVISKVYRDAFTQNASNSITAVFAPLAAQEAAEEAQKNLNDFKLMDAVEVDEEGINEGTPIHNIKENGNDIEIELYKKWARGIFGCIKYGTPKQLEVVKAFMSDELYSKFFLQEKAFERDGLSFVTEDLVIKKCSIYDYARSLDKEEIKVLIEANMKEYIIEKHTKKVLRGDKNLFSTKKVLMTFVKKESEEKEGLIPNCPNCGTAVSQTELGKCKYCGTIILPIRYNWTLTKFETM